MKRAIKALAISAIAIVPLLAAANPASANPARGMQGSWVGAGVGVGGIGDPTPGNSAELGGNVQARIQPVNRVPVSLRSGVLFNSNGTSIPVAVTYDAGIARNTNLFVGAGYNFADSNDNGPLGDQNAPMATVGIEHAPLRNLVIYSDVKVGIDAYASSSDPAVAVSAGVGYRF
jgi:Outer membrane protein beta-barrel domain